MNPYVFLQPCAARFCENLNPNLLPVLEADPQLAILLQIIQYMSGMGRRAEISHREMVILGSNKRWSKDVKMGQSSD